MTDYRERARNLIEDVWHRNATYAEERLAAEFNDVAREAVASDLSVKADRKALRRYREEFEKIQEMYSGEYGTLCVLDIVKQIREQAIRAGVRAGSYWAHGVLARGFRRGGEVRLTPEIEDKLVKVTADDMNRDAIVAQVMEK